MLTPFGGPPGSLCKGLSCLHLCRSGDNIACIGDAYGGTLRYLNTVCVPVYGFTVSYVDLTTAGPMQRVEPRIVVLWADAEVEPDSVWDELRRRENQSGLEEKLQRDDNN